MDDDDLEIEVLTPQRHNRWAVIVPALGFIAEASRAFSETFTAYTIYAAQHGMQKHYDQQFKGVISSGYSGVRSGEVFPED
jgi:hypothetical protein